jgi:WD40 repeat protein
LSISIWDTKTDELQQGISEKSGIGPFAFSPDAKKLVAVLGDKSLQLYAPVNSAGSVSPEGRAEAAQETYTAKVQFKGSHKFNPAAVTFAAEDTYIVSAGWDGRVVFWDAKTGNRLRTTDMGEVVSSLCYCPVTKQLAAGTYGGTIRIWDFRAPSLQQVQFQNIQVGDSIGAMDFSPEGSRLAVGLGNQLAPPTANANQGRLFLLPLPQK